MSVIYQDQYIFIMDNTIYNLVTAEIGNLDALTQTSNNIANAEVAGYKGNILLFRQYLTKDIGGEDNINYTNTMPQDFSTVIDHTPGALKTTNRTLDFAISGEGFFSIQTPSGIRYSRNGVFTLNNNNQLVTPEGNPVLSNNNSIITFDPGDKKIVVSQEGIIYVTSEDNTVQNRDTLGIVTFDNLKLLRQAENNLFITNQEPIAASNYQLIQGALEEANINPMIAVTSLIEIQRNNQAVTSRIGEIYSIYQKTYKVLSE
jgi:flagellar basal-body rod protein FlgF